MRARKEMVVPSRQRPCNALLAFTAISASLVLPVPTGATTSRWSALSFPSLLGQDEASVEFFPQLAATVPQGVSGDVSGDAPRYLWLHHLGSMRTLVGSAAPSEFRLGLAGGNAAQRPWGVQAWGLTDRTSNSTEPSGGTDPTESITENDSFGLDGGLGFGAADGVHLSLGGGVALRRRREKLVDGPELEPADQPSWRAAVLLDRPAGVGRLRVGARASLDRAQADAAPLSPTGRHDKVGVREEEETLHLAWLAPVADLDLFHTGLSLTRSKFRNRSLARNEQLDLRRLEVTARVGLERELTPWCLVRGGASKGYSDRKQTLRPGDGPRQSSTGSRRLQDPSGTVGLGLRHRDLTFDLDVDTGAALGHALTRASVRWVR